MSSPATVIARTQVRRTIRTVVGDRMKLLMMAGIALLALGPVTAVGLLILPAFGEEVATGAVDAPIALEIVSGVTALAWLFLILMAGIRTFTAAANLDQPALVLLSAPLRSTVIGNIVAEILLFAIWLVPPVVVYSAAFASGAGTVFPALAIPFVAVLLLVTAVPIGFVVGTWARHLLTVYEPIARYRTPVIILLALAYFGSIATGWFDTVATFLFDLVGDGPLGWFGHVLFLGIPTIDPDPTAVVGALVGSAILIPVAVAIGVVSARVHWYADPARIQDDTEPAATGEGSDRLSAFLDQGLSKPVRTMTVTTIRRTKRSPIRLAYAAYPLFGMLFFAQEIIEAGTVPSYIAVLLCLYVVWGTGVLFALNPLGDFGRALPAVMTSSVAGKTAVRSRIIASALVGVPLAVVVSLSVGIISPLSLEETAMLAAGTILGALVAPALAVGIGSAFPRFGSVAVTSNKEAVMPSKVAFLVYSAGIILPTIAAVVLYTEAAPLAAQIATALIAALPELEFTITGDQLTLAAWAVLIAGIVAPPVAYRYAVEQFDWYRID
ncbi:hypothetical protein C483_14285 [Natrialba hulunbeirensis JCM 10989]|uniref:Uncharacterized protein n=1 Tax=Natrialba hulunbeirensis JCM 10989 TaxID=1227493 RepID=L9ZSQ9_9EURY|nr:hypothetical protein [Natrialba hulunbeirensis]ELY89126.1 hypothetical protein C483_14285 [Natrialba hulunbeirensis JCM 10989]